MGLSEELGLDSMPVTFTTDIALYIKFLCEYLMADQHRYAAYSERAPR